MRIRTRLTIICLLLGLLYLNYSNLISIFEASPGPIQLGINLKESQSNYHMAIQRYKNKIRIRFDIYTGYVDGQRKLAGADFYVLDHWNFQRWQSKQSFSPHLEYRNVSSLDIVFEAPRSDYYFFVWNNTEPIFKYGDFYLYYLELLNYDYFIPGIMLTALGSLGGLLLAFNRFVLKKRLGGRVAPGRLHWLKVLNALAMEFHMVFSFPFLELFLVLAFISAFSGVPDFPGYMYPFSPEMALKFDMERVANWFSTELPMYLMFVFPILFSFRVTGEYESGVLGSLLTRPIGRSKLLSYKFLACLIGPQLIFYALIMARLVKYNLNGITYFPVSFSFSIFPSVFLLSLFFSCISCLFSVLFNRTAVATLFSASIIMICNWTIGLSKYYRLVLWWIYLPSSIEAQAWADLILGGGSMVLLSIACLTLSYHIFSRKEF